MTLLAKCVCGGEGSFAESYNAIPLLRCTDCGVLRQDVRMSSEEVSEWYRLQYHSGKYSHSYRHDQHIARFRLTAYALPRGAKLLDVGCGNGAFVYEARDQNLDAWGQDLAQQSGGPFTYVGALEDIAFPTDGFDVVTMHDVLEHSPTPKELLAECRRILRPTGQLIVDFPRFHVVEGTHHWKLVEHLWMFDEAQLQQLLRDCGFNVESVKYPIPSKIVITATPVAEKRPQILVPSGIGDAYWVMTKLPGFLKANNLGLPDVWVQDSAKGLKRTEPFLQTLPMVHAAGYKESHPRDPVFMEAYFRDARTVFPDALDSDYFIAYNGVMRFGKSLEEVDTEFGCDWYPKMHVSKEASKFQGELEMGGPYAVVYLVGHGMYGKWLADFTMDQIREAIRRISSDHKLQMVFVGAKWDEGSIGDQLAKENPAYVNLVGQTTYEQLNGALRGASFVFGYPSGATLLAPTFHRPTVLLWHNYFHKDFWVHSVAPNEPYRALGTKDLTVRDVLNAASSVMGK